MIFVFTPTEKMTQLLADPSAYLLEQVDSLKTVFDDPKTIIDEARFGQCLSLAFSLFATFRKDINDKKYEDGFRGAIKIYKKAADRHEERFIQDADLWILFFSEVCASAKVCEMKHSTVESMLSIWFKFARHTKISTAMKNNIWEKRSEKM